MSLHTWLLHRADRPSDKEVIRFVQATDSNMLATTIALLPFENLTGDPEQEYFARGFVEDLAT